MEQIKQPKILLVGGGIAGISAAKELINAGLKDVTILEAKERLGGRIHTIKHGNKHLEIGAQWIHGEENNPLYDIAVSNDFIAKEEDINSFEEYWETQFFLQNGQQIDPSIVRETCEVLDEIFDEADKFYREKKPLSDNNESMGMFLFDTFYKYLRTTECDPAVFRIKEAIFHWRQQVEKTECGCKSVFSLSAHGWGQFQECKGQEEVTLCAGYQALLDLLLQDIPDSAIRTNSPVQCIYWGEGERSHPLFRNNEDIACSRSRDYPVVVRMKSGELLSADHVIVTASLGVLKKTAHVMFKPVLPANKMAAIERLGFGTVDKLYIEWEEPWWSKDTHAIQLAWVPDEHFHLEGEQDNKRSGLNDEWYRGIHAFELVDYQPKLLCGWIAGAEAEMMETVPDSIVLHVCHELLKRFTGNTNIPKPTCLIRSRWGHDPYTVGSYSYIHVGSSGQDMENLAQPLPSKQCPQLLFAGEATHPDYFSTVHGALVSGQREATRLMQYYNTTQTN